MEKYKPYKSLVEPAQESAAVLRLLLGIILFVVGVLAVNVAIIQIAQALRFDAILSADANTGQSSTAVLFVLFSFGLFALVLWVVLRLVHGRSMRSLIGNVATAFHDFWRVMRALVILLAVLFIVPAPDGYQLIAHIPLSQWLLLLPFAVAALAVQVGTEELVFRGYLQSQLAARFASPFIWMAVPSVIFGLLHYDPFAYGPNALLVAIWAIAFGMAAADLTARTGTLGAAFALHLANNMSAFLLVAFQGHWDGLALFTMPFAPENTDMVRNMLWVEAPVLLCMWLAARVALRR